MNRDTQITIIMEHMKAHGSITDSEARDIGINCLSSRISDMVKRGISIEKQWVNGMSRYGYKTRYIRYFLTEVRENA